jgi:hypothetical protein
LTVCLFRCTYLSVLFYIVIIGVRPTKARFHALPLLLHDSASASLTVPHHRCDHPTFTVHALSYKVLLSLTAVDYCCSSSELPLSIESLNTQNCACLKGIMSAGVRAPSVVCTCPVAKSGAVLATFPLLLPCFENVCNSMKLSFFNHFSTQCLASTPRM